METQAKKTKGGPSGAIIQEGKRMLAIRGRAVSSLGRRNQKQNKEPFEQKSMF